MSRRNKNNQISILFPILTIIGVGLLTMLSSFYKESWMFDWSDIRKNIKDSIEVAQYDNISNGSVGFLYERPKEYKRKIWIMNNATNSELLKLIDYPNGTIKAISYEGLIRKKDFEDKMELTLKSIDDTKFIVDFRAGCTGMPMEISSYIVQRVLYIDDSIPPPPIGMQNQFHFPEDEKQIILSQFYNRPKIILSSTDNENLRIE